MVAIIIQRIETAVSTMNANNWLRLPTSTGVGSRKKKASRRKYRDEVLKTPLPGSTLIKIYYFVSSHLVKNLKSDSRITNMTRRILDKFISKIEKRNMIKRK